MSKLTDSEGKTKFKTLSLFCLCILTLPHGNAELERGFSINKAILAVHGFSLQADTLEALRFVKDLSRILLSRMEVVTRLKLQRN